MLYSIIGDDMKNKKSEVKTTKTEAEKNNSINLPVIVAFAMGFAIAVIVCSIIFKPAADLDSNKNDNEPKTVEEDNKMRYPYESEEERAAADEQWRKQNEEYEKASSKWLEEKGFTINEEAGACSKYYATTCYVKGNFVAEPSGPYTYFYKDVKESSLEGYALEEDVAFFEELYDFTISEDLINQLKDYIGTFKHNSTDNFNIYIDDLYFSFDWRSGNGWNSDYIEYMFDKRDYNDYESLTPERIDIFNSGNSNEAKNNNRKALYEIIMNNNNKEHYTYNDYAPIHFEGNSEDICNIEYITKEGYTFEGSFCHGGTSTTYFKVESGREDEQDYDRVILEMEPEVFKEKYMEILNKDLEYFNSRLETNYKLTNNDNNMTNLRNIVENKTEKVSLTLSDSFQIDIEFKYDDYYVTYIIR